MDYSDKIILVVDDELAHRMLAKRVIKKTCPGAKILEAESVKTALDHISNNKLSLITLDLNLAGESGFDILERYRMEHDFDDFPVVILSTSSLQRDFLLGYELGANSYLVKVPDPDLYNEQLTGALKFFL